MGEPKRARLVEQALLPLAQASAENRIVPQEGVFGPLGVAQDGIEPVIALVREALSPLGGVIVPEEGAFRRRQRIDMGAACRITKAEQIRGLEHERGERAQVRGRLAALVKCKHDVTRPPFEPHRTPPPTLSSRGRARERGLTKPVATAMVNNWAQRPIAVRFFVNSSTDGRVRRPGDCEGSRNRKFRFDHPRQEAVRHARWAPGAYIGGKCWRC